MKAVDNNIYFNNSFYDPYYRCLHYVEMIIEDYINDNRDHDVVSYVNKRIKSEDSIKEKLNRHSLECSVDSAINNLRDIAGIRIVCPFLKDVYGVINYLRTNPYLDVVLEKDYITSPKKSGYRSYHMIVNVKDSILDGEKVRVVPVEVQIRTLAMDCSAVLEHRTRYKKESNNNNIINDKKTVWILSDDMNKKIENSTEKMIEIDEKLNNILENSNTLDQEYSNIYGREYDLYKYKYAKAKLKLIVRRIAEELNNDFEKPVEAAKVRLKSSKSINKKLKSRNKNSIDEIHDVVAARLICPFLSDLDKVIDKIIFNTEFKIIGFKDYVNNPKDNGYSSFHILVKIPVYIDGITDYVKAEIQVRTIIMNMWASLHHKLCYEQNDTSSEVAEMLKKWASDLREIDINYDDIYKCYCKKIKEQENNKVKVKQLIKNN